MKVDSMGQGGDCMAQHLKDHDISLTYPGKVENLQNLLWGAGFPTTNEPGQKKHENAMGLVL